MLLIILKISISYNFHDSNYQIAGYASGILYKNKYLIYPLVTYGFVSL
jgi:hypothetical protein